MHASFDQASTLRIDTQLCWVGLVTLDMIPLEQLVPHTTADTLFFVHLLEES